VPQKRSDLSYHGMIKHKKKKARKQRAARLIGPLPPHPTGIWAPQKVVAELTLAVLEVGYLARRSFPQRPPLASGSAQSAPSRN